MVGCLLKKGFLDFSCFVKNTSARPKESCAKKDDDSSSDDEQVQEVSIRHKDNALVNSSSVMWNKIIFNEED